MPKRLRDFGFKAHRGFVTDIKAAVIKSHGRIPDPGSVSPRILGKQPLGFPVPPMMEDVFGYGGALVLSSFRFLRQLSSDIRMGEIVSYRMGSCGWNS